MKIPKSIEPDRIKDAIIEVHFESELPNEINLGLFFGVLKEYYKYSNKSLGTKQLTSNSASFEKEITLSLGGVSLFYNDEIKFQINQNSIAFNCIDKYILWENYSKQIANVLQLMLNVNSIKSFSRVGVRYVSEYINSDLVDSTNFSFSFGMPEVASKSYSFRSEFDIEQFTVVLNLSNNIPVIIDSNLTPISIIDIDVISTNFDIGNSFEKLFNIINNAHNLEKEIFFKILKDSFLNSLNPKY